MEFPHSKLLDCRNKKIITTAEYMVLFNWYFGNWTQFLMRLNLSEKKLRELYISGINKIKRYVKTLEA